MNGGGIDALFPKIVRRLAMTDIDQEVKQAAIHSTAQCLSTAGSNVSASSVSEAIGYITERLKSEVTRITGLKALKTVCSGASHINFTLDPVIVELCRLLH